MSVSVYCKDRDLYISYPAVIGKNGVEYIIYPDLNSKENEKMEHSISVVKDNISKIY